jgi:hypothetical protein
MPRKNQLAERRRGTQDAGGHGETEHRADAEETLGRHPNDFYPAHSRGGPGAAAKGGDGTEEPLP